jgi:hypothetical protein
MSLDPNWEATQLRLSVFLSQWRLTDDDWACFAGVEPEIRHQQGGQTTWAGRALGAWLQVTAAIGRVDVNLLPIPPSEGELPRSFAGKLAELLPSFRPAAKSFLQRLASARADVSRLAFGGVAHLPTVDVRSSYEALKAQLKSVEVNPDTMSDLLFQVNYKSMSRVVEGLAVNRLAVWSSVIIRLAEVMLHPQVIQGGVASEQFGMRVTLDINTPAETARLPEALLPDLFAELEELGINVLVHGEPQP